MASDGEQHRPAGGRECIPAGSTTASRSICRYGAGRVSLGSADKGGAGAAAQLEKLGGVHSFTWAGATRRARNLSVPAMLCRKALALLSRVRAYS
jgi:hypothetical protein